MSTTALSVKCKQLTGILRDLSGHASCFWAGGEPWRSQVGSPATQPCFSFSPPFLLLSSSGGPRTHFVVQSWPETDPPASAPVVGFQVWAVGPGSDLTLHHMLLECCDFLLWAENLEALFPDDGTVMAFSRALVCASPWLCIVSGVQREFIGATQ